MPLFNRGSKLLRISEVLYSSLWVLLFYLLIASRTGEAQTVWQALHPAFIPTLFTATFLLLVILFSSEKTTLKVFLVIILSVLLHSLFSIIFPAGDLSGQQTVLGRTRRVFDNTILHGSGGWPENALPVAIIQVLIGTNFQAALSTIFARMLSIDIFYVHLFLVPILWGVFVTIASFLTAKTMGANDEVSVLSSLLVSAFPYTIYFGAISVPNSLGFIFFLYSLYFMLKYLSSNDSRTAYWMMVFTFFSFLSHYLTGIMSFSLLLLSLVFKAYRSEERSSIMTVRVSLMVSFIVCASLLPMSFIYLKFLSPPGASFTLDKIYRLSLVEILGQAFVGDFIYGFELRTTLSVIQAPVIPILCIVFILYRFRRNNNKRLRGNIYFLIVAFVIMLVDYAVLRLFMSSLPINEERLWVFRDLIAAPLVALAIYEVVLALQSSLEARSIWGKVTSLNTLLNANILRISSLLIILNILIPAVVGIWITSSFNAAYPHVGAPLQTTWYELEAVNYIKEKTKEKYVVISDTWTIFAGEMVEGVYNPNAFYFGENDKRGYYLFNKACSAPSPEVMIEAMNQTGTDTTTAYFVVAEPRLGTEKFNDVVARAQGALTVFLVTGSGKLYVFIYRKE